MKNLGKVAGYNIGFILLYAILLRLFHDQMSIMIFSMFLVIFQTLGNFIAAISLYASNKTEIAHSFLLTTFLVLIIGFGVCVTPVHF